MKITKTEVEYVAHLARLNFRDEEKEKFTSQLNDILMYMDILEKVKTDNVKPMSHAISLTNAFRNDEVKKSVGAERILSTAPDENNNCFRVPKVIE